MFMVQCQIQYSIIIEMKLILFPLNPEHLMDELRRNGVKIKEEDVV